MHVLHERPQDSPPRFSFPVCVRFAGFACEAFEACVSQSWPQGPLYGPVVGLSANPFMDRFDIHMFHNRLILKHNSAHLTCPFRPFRNDRYHWSPLRAANWHIWRIHGVFFKWDEGLIYPLMARLAYLWRVLSRADTALHALCLQAR